MLIYLLKKEIVREFKEQCESDSNGDCDGDKKYQGNDEGYNCVVMTFDTEDDKADNRTDQQCKAKKRD